MNYKFTRFAIGALSVCLSVAIYKNHNQTHIISALLAKQSHVGVAEQISDLHFVDSTKPLASTKNSTEAAIERIRQLLSAGLSEQATEIIEIARIDSLDSGWSDGCWCWYASLSYRMSGDNHRADLELRKAKQLGIAELQPDAETFWAQHSQWDFSAGVTSFESHMSRRGDSLPMQYVSYRPSSVSENTRGIVEEIRLAQNAVENCKEEDLIKEQVRLATWELLLGEYTNKMDSLSLWTTSVNSFHSGRQRLSEIEAQIKISPELEDKISEDPGLAIRLDTARVRLVALQRKQETSREEEVARLQQLRQVARDYRAVCEKMMQWQIYHVLQDPTKAAESAQESVAALSRVFNEVERRRDFHLFDDEPQVDGSSEFEIVQTAPTAFGTEPLAMLKALQGLSFYRLVRDQSSSDPSRLLEAKSWASAALDSQQNVAGLPGTADPNNLVAKLVLGLVEDALGQQLAFADDPTERQKAAAHFAAAKDNLSAFIDHLKASGYADTPVLTTEVQSRLNHLISTESSIAEAAEQYATEQPNSARETLLAATKRHRDAATALGSIEVGLRAGFSPDELQAQWQRFVELEIFTGDNAVARLAWAKIVNHRAGIALASSLDDETTQKCIDDLSEVAKILSAHVDDTKLAEGLRAQLKSNFALAMTYRWALGGVVGDDKATLNKHEIEVAYRHARDAEYFLVAWLKDRNSLSDTAEVVSAREALVSAWVSNGHLAALYLDDWRDESQTFFAAAASEANRLKGSSPVIGLIGAPLLRQVFERSQGGNAKLANQERQRRQMVTRCLEAMFTTRFGAPAAGAEQMEQAIEAGLATSETSDAIDPAQLSAGADGFDAKVTLVDTVRCFAVLSDIQAQRASKALSKAIALASHDELILKNTDLVTVQHLQACTSNIQSPLVAFSLGRAIEAVCEQSSPAEQIEQRNAFAQQALLAFKRGRELLNADRLAVRYPHLLALVDRSIDQLSNPEAYVGQVAELAKQQRTAESLEIATQGLARHPLEKSLWVAYFQARIKQAVAQNNSDDASLGLILQEVGSAGKRKLLSPYDSAFNSGKILDLLGRQHEARSQYQSAAELATTPSQRIAASSHIGRLRISMIQ